MALGHGVKL